MGDLAFRNGILDAHHVNQILKNKQNMHAEVAVIKEALLPYKHFLQQENTVAANTITLKRSRNFYKEFEYQLLACNPIISKGAWLSCSIKNKLLKCAKEHPFDSASVHPKLLFSA